MERKTYLFALTCMAVLGAASLAASSEGEQDTFATPRQAALALLSAAEADDLPELARMFGPEANEVLNSGDPVQDKGNRELFVKRATQSIHVRVGPNASRAILLLGNDRFPFPIPLERTSGRWHFDTAAGKKEILARRIGSNELDAIAACKAYVSAQYDYASEDRNRNGIPEYAQNLISSPGKRDGLFWPGADSPPTTFAAGVKKALTEGYRKGTPYHGYYFRILLGQGSKAHGGALEYVQHGSMIGGFALVAWPSEYGVSGVKSFLVNQDGVVYEKDLGRSSSAVAENIKIFDPDPTWGRIRLPRHP